jgi:hypothetical protein
MHWISATPSGLVAAVKMIDRQLGVFVAHRHRPKVEEEAGCAALRSVDTRIEPFLDQFLMTGRLQRVEQANIGVIIMASE